MRVLSVDTAGCLDISLDGAGHVVVFDASWNPRPVVFQVYCNGRTCFCHIHIMEKMYNRPVSSSNNSADNF